MKKGNYLGTCRIINIINRTDSLESFKVLKVGRRVKIVEKVFQRSSAFVYCYSRSVTIGNFESFEHTRLNIWRVFGGKIFDFPLDVYRRFQLFRKHLFRCM